MKIVALIPFLLDYKPLKGSLNSRSLIEISGKSLISRTVEIINHISLIDKTVVFSSSKEAFDCIENNMNCVFLKRSDDLDTDKTSIEDIIDGFLQDSDAEVIVLINPKSPFIKPQTIEECIEKVLTNKFDSAFISKNVKGFAWYEGKPLNYSNHSDTPLVSQLTPVLFESSSIYIFTRKLFKKSRSRIGEKPYIKEVGHFEGIEIDNKDDLTMTELMINAGLDKEAL